MINYLYRNDPDDKETKRECDCCGYPAPLALFKDTRTELEIKDIWFCKICASTHLAIAITYPAQCPDTKLYKAVAWIGNYLKEEHQ